LRNITLIIMVNYNSKNIPKCGLLGIGIDNKDEHTRITRGDNFYLHGGSEETHDRSKGKIRESRISPQIN
jgi:hypothetical protein